MTTELDILAAYGIVVLCTILAQILSAMATENIGWLVGPRDDPRPDARLTGRLKRAMDNSVAAMAYFAPAILLLHLSGKTGAETLLAAQIFLIARIVYVGFYAIGIKWLRTVIWMIGAFASVYLYFIALT